MRILLVLALTAASPASSYGQAATEAPQSGDVRVAENPGTAVRFDMVYHAGGEFVMGTPMDEEGRDADEMAPMPVSVSPFWMAAREVSFEEYAAFRYPDRDTSRTWADGTPYEADAVARPSPPYEDPAFGMGNGGFPATGMTQWGALQYARWLSDKTGEFFRLPTEAEWEYACRAGGGPASDPRDLARQAWYWENSGEVFQKIGTKDPNTLGVYDLLGNVSEWTLDEYAEDYAAALEEAGTQDPWVMPARLHPRTVKGGAYDDDAESLRCGDRLRSNMDWKRRDPQIPKSFWWNTDSPFVGFRLVRPAMPPSAEEQEMFWMMVLGE